MPDMGTARCDFPNGSAQTLWESVHKILTLEPKTRIFVGHDYAPGGREHQWETTVENEKKHNKVSIYYIIIENKEKEKRKKKF